MAGAIQNDLDAAAEHRPAPAELDSHGDGEHAGSRTEWIRVGFVALVLLVVWSGFVPRVAGIDWLALAGIAIGGYPIFKEAIFDLLKGHMTMELSMTIALAAAAGIGEFFTALLITLFVLIAEIIEGMTVGRGRRAIGKLLDLLPHSAEVRADGQVAPRDLSEVRAGDVVVVRPGGHIPVDGIVVTGHSFVDQASITGESLPVEKSPGTEVFAGTINHSGVLEIEAEKVGRDTAFGRIIEAVERAENSRAPIQRLADRLAGYLVYFALGCAALTFFITRDARSPSSSSRAPAGLQRAHHWRFWELSAAPPGTAPLSKAACIWNCWVQSIPWSWTRRGH
jgi:Cd2+/Zn2+-exporting ATPase/Cu+-exporting ATPase